MKNKILIVITFLAGILMFNSCLKDKLNSDWTDALKGKMYAQVTTYGFAADATGKVTATLDAIPGTQSFRFMVNIATDQLPTSDITLTIAVDPAAMAAYNTKNGTDFQVYPYIVLSNTSITIKAGTRSTYVDFSLTNADKLSACDNFMIPISITQASGSVIIAANMKSLLMGLPIANPYQGLYHASGVFIHPTAGTRVIDEDKDLTTVNCNTVGSTAGDLGSADPMTIKVNADNSVTIGGQISASQPLIMTPGAVNKYDPATKTFTLNYQYSGAGGDRVIKEVLVKK